MSCQRCHRLICQCPPPIIVDSSDRIAELEAQVAALTNRAKNAENETSIYKEENEKFKQQRDDLLESFEVLRDRVKDEFDRLYIAGVIAKVKK